MLLFTYPLQALGQVLSCMLGTEQGVTLIRPVDTTMETESQPACLCDSRHVTSTVRSTVPKEPCQRRGRLKQYDVTGLWEAGVLGQTPQGKDLQRQVWGDFEESLVEGHLQMSSMCVCLLGVS